VTEALAPLVPADVDLRGLGGFMLRTDRLLSSELVALGSPEECWAAVLLWCRAWQQTPAASLPNDERVLASFSGAGKRWPKVKAMAMRGFVLCSDNRWYHRVLAAEALEAWERRLRFRERSNKANKARHSAALQGDLRGSLQGVHQGDLQGVLQDHEVKGSEVKGSEGTLKPKSTTLSGKPDVAPEARPNGHGNGAYNAEAERVLEYLNRATGHAYRFRHPNGGRLTPNGQVIVARLHEGYTGEQLREVVLLKSEQWRSDAKMAQYLRPQTLFGAQKFAQYVGELGVPA